MALLGLPLGFDRSAKAAPPWSNLRSPAPATRPAGMPSARSPSIGSRRKPGEGRIGAVVREHLSPSAVKVIDCNPDLYLFLVRHPDVVVNIWELMKLSRLQLRQVDENLFQIAEPAGTVAQFSFVYRSHDLHVLYGEGNMKGRC